MFFTTPLKWLTRKQLLFIAIIAVGPCSSIEISHELSNLKRCLSGSISYNSNTSFLYTFLYVKHTWLPVTDVRVKIFFLQLKFSCCTWQMVVESFNGRSARAREKNDCFIRDLYLYYVKIKLRKSVKQSQNFLGTDFARLILKYYYWQILVLTEVPNINAC